MLIKISALIYTLASIAFITLMIMRPAVEIEAQPVQNNTITVNTDSNTINTESDSKITPIASPNENMDNLPLNTSATAMENTTPATENTTIPEVPTTMPAAGEIAPKNSTETIVPTPLKNSAPLENSTNEDHTNSAVPPKSTVIPATVVPPVPAENPVVAPSAVPTETTPTPVSPQSHLNNPENQGASTAPIAIPTPKALASEEQQIVFPNTNTTMSNQVTPPSSEPIAVDAIQQVPSNVMDTPVVDVLAEDVKKNTP